MACLISALSGSGGFSHVTSASLQQAAVHPDHLAGDVARRVGGEKRHERRHLARRAGSPDGHRLQVGRPAAAGIASIISVSISPGATAFTSTPLAARSRDSARVKPSSPPLTPHSRLAGQRHPRARRRHVDDAAPAAQQHAAHHGADAAVGGIEIHAHHFVPARASSSTTCVSRVMPALLTRISTGPSSPSPARKTPPRRRRRRRRTARPRRGRHGRGGRLELARRRFAALKGERHRRAPLGQQFDNRRGRCHGSRR